MKTRDIIIRLVEGTDYLELAKEDFIRNSVYFKLIKLGPGVFYYAEPWRIECFKGPRDPNWSKQMGSWSEEELLARVRAYINANGEKLKTGLEQEFGMPVSEMEYLDGPFESAEYGVTLVVFVKDNSR